MNATRGSPSYRRPRAAISRSIAARHPGVVIVGRQAAPVVVVRRLLDPLGREPVGQPRGASRDSRRRSGRRRACPAPRGPTRPAAPRPRSRTAPPSAPVPSRGRRGRPSHRAGGSGGVGVRAPPLQRVVERPGRRRAAGPRPPPRARRPVPAPGNRRENPEHEERGRRSPSRSLAHLNLMIGTGRNTRTIPPDFRASPPINRAVFRTGPKPARSLGTGRNGLDARILGPAQGEIAGKSPAADPVSAAGRGSGGARHGRCNPETRGPGRTHRPLGPPRDDLLCWNSKTSSSRRSARAGSSRRWAPAGRPPAELPQRRRDRPGPVRRHRLGPGGAGGCRSDELPAFEPAGAAADDLLRPVEDPGRDRHLRRALPGPQRRDPRPGAGAELPLRRPEDLRLLQRLPGVHRQVPAGR